VPIKRSGRCGRVAARCFPSYDEEDYTADRFHRSEILRTNLASVHPADDAFKNWGIGLVSVLFQSPPPKMINWWLSFAGGTQCLLIGKRLIHRTGRFNLSKLPLIREFLPGWFWQQNDQTAWMKFLVIASAWAFSASTWTAHGLNKQAAGLKRHSKI